MSYVLAIDQGTTSSRAILFRADTSIAALAQQEFPQHFPAPGWVEHDAEDIWRATLATAARRCRGRRRGAATSRPSASPTSARPPWSGTARPGEPIHRAIVWQDRRTADVCARLKREGHEADVAAKTGLARSIPISPAPRSPGCSTTCRARARAPSAANSRSAPSTAGCSGGSPAARCTPPTPPTPRARCSSTSTAAAGTTSCWAVRRAARDAARGARLLRRFRRDRRRALRRRDPDPRHRRRPAGGDRRPGLFRARHDEIDLRHRLLRADQHRRDARRLAEPAADDDRLPARRQAHLRARRRDLRRRRRRAMAARRPRHHRRRRRNRRAGGPADRAQRRLSRAGLRRARRAATGTRTRAARCSA